MCLIKDESNRCARTRHFVDKLFKPTVYATCNLGILYRNNPKGLGLKCEKYISRGNTFGV